MKYRLIISKTFDEFANVLSQPTCGWAIE